MKTFTIFLSLLICSVGSSTNTDSNYVADNTPKIFEKIQHNMQVPDLMKNTVSSERVRVVFTIDEKGKAHVIDVNTNRPELKDSVKQQFEAIDFSDSKETNNQEFSIWLNFKVM